MRVPMLTFSGDAVADKLNRNFADLSKVSELVGDTFIAVNQSPGSPTRLRLRIEEVASRVPKLSATGDGSFWGRVVSNEYSAGAVIGWNIEECNADGSAVTGAREGLLTEGNQWAGLRWPHTVSDGMNGLILRVWPVDLEADPPTYRTSQLHPIGIAAKVSALATTPDLPFQARLLADSGTGGYASAAFDCWPPHPMIESVSGSWYPDYAVDQRIWICGAGDVYSDAQESSVWRDMTPRIPLAEGAIVVD